MLCPAIWFVVVPEFEPHIWVPSNMVHAWTYEFGFLPAVLQAVPLVGGVVVLIQFVTSAYAFLNIAAFVDDDNVRIPIAGPCCIELTKKDYFGSIIGRGGKENPI
jgi:hypothetical protein